MGPPKRVRAIPLDADAIPLVERGREGRRYLDCPAGGAEAGESLQAALIREEAGPLVETGDMVATVVVPNHVRECFQAPVAGCMLGSDDGLESHSPGPAGAYRPACAPFRVAPCRPFRPTWRDW